MNGINALSQPEILHSLFCRKVIVNIATGFPSYRDVVASIPWSEVLYNIGRPIHLILAFAIRNLSKGSHNLHIDMVSPSGEHKVTEPWQLMIKEATNTYYTQVHLELQIIQPGDFIFRLFIDGNFIATSILPIVPSR